MYKTTLLGLALLAALLTTAQQKNIFTSTSIPYKELKTGFADPPSEARLRCYWWWLNSMATKESITRDLEEMKDKGYGGVSIFDAGSSSYQAAAKTAAGPIFMSPEWMELYKHTVKEADRLGIEISVNVQSGWNPGAPTITPEFALKKITWSETDITGGSEIKIKLPKPESTLIYRDIFVQAVKRPSDKNPLKNDVIKYWDIKSFNKNMGAGGNFPFEQLSDNYPETTPYYAIKKAEIIDLTGNFKDSILQWKAPGGNWTILRYGWTCTGVKTSTTSDGWNGLSLDHLSTEAFELFSKDVILPLITTAQSVGKSVHFLQTDSWEMNVINWAQNFPAEFKKRRGYDLMNYMPVMTGRVVESREITDRFLSDLRKTVGDCVADNHYQLFYNLAHKYGLGIHPESGGPHSAPIDALKVMGISDFPQGEFWAVANTHRVSDAQRLSVKQSACVAHTNGKRFVAAEGPTSIGPQWERSPKDLKGNLDRIFCSGVNRIVWHTFTSSPKEYGLPGNEYFAGTHLNPNVTWWKQSKDFISYLDRTSFLLQQGLFTADVLCYYGDDVPNFAFLKEDLPELNFGYDWDKCSKEIIINKITYDGKKLVLPDGMSYSVLMLAPKKAIDLEVLKKVEILVNAGATVISPRPEQVTGLSGFPESDRELKAITDRLWGKIDGKSITENKVGKGRIIWGVDINKVLAGMNVKPDFTFNSNQPKTALDYIHRSTNTEEIYFVANRFARKGIDDFEFRYLTNLPDRYEQVECSFRVNGKTPQLWNPKTGEISEVLTYREENGKTILPLHLEPEGSVFVIFKEAKAEKHITTIEKDGKTLFPVNQFDTKGTPYIEATRKDGKPTVVVYAQGKYNLTWSDGMQQTIFEAKGLAEKELTGKWNLHFDPKWGGPDKLEINVLKSWIKFDEPGIKYYSGTANYSKSFTLTSDEIKNKQVTLDLGNVQEMASVKINGRQLQVMWSAPFKFDITSHVKPGTNDLEVEVVNLWPNRLIGDSKLPMEQRLTKTNINKFNVKDSETFLRESGLLGPVKIEINNKYIAKY
ncbi:MAG: glycosyl hydrolase [Mariniphaga sp.]